MEFTDEEYFEIIKDIIHILPDLFASDTAIGLTDKERFVSVKQSDAFKLNIEVGTPIIEGGASQNCLRTREIDRRKSPKEIFGHSIISITIPIINKSTGNILGTLISAVSQEKEDTIVEMADTLKNFSVQLTASAQEMASSAEELSSSSRNISDLANKSSIGINKMDDILKYITEISNTTNMLGLNAAIEAARAGDHGKGFSVVAQEIRNLASASKTSVVDIAENLKNIKNDISSILEFLNAFTITSEKQAHQAEQLSLSSENLNNSADKLFQFTRDY